MPSAAHEPVKCVQHPNAVFSILVLAVVGMMLASLGTWSRHTMSSLASLARSVSVLIIMNTRKIEYSSNCFGAPLTPLVNRVAYSCKVHYFPVPAPGKWGDRRRYGLPLNFVYKYTYMSSLLHCSLLLLLALQRQLFSLVVAIECLPVQLKIINLVVQVLFWHAFTVPSLTLKRRQI